ncbi:macrolide export ATP-binding/permease protein MacB [archaeon BMS3Abin17]|nr:macrolide export ATP-binding/permease protein MacB [archaeon BMS3Abin17]HDZ60114.1 ABC transporter permease [Candidatus Pacearchaeota archaeon]
MLKDYFSLAFGNLRHRGLRSWLTILGIFIGIAAVVALISMGAGLKEAVTGQFGALSVDRLTIQNKQTGFAPPGSAVVEKLNEDDLRIIEGINGVDKVVTRLIRVGSLEYNGVKGFGYAADIPDDPEDAEFVYDSLKFKAKEGRLLKQGDNGMVLLGNNFMTTPDFGREMRVGKRVKINGKDFEVIGFLEKTSNFQMNSIVLLLTSDLEDLMDIENEYDMIIAQVEDKDEIEDVSKEIERKLRNDRKEKIGEESFTVETPLEAISSVNTILNIINLIVIGIAMISLFVGGVGIANTMYTSVLERTREIGVMKAIGAQNKDVLMIFLIESGMLGLVGGIVGALIGLGAAMGISALANQALGGNLFLVTISYPLLIGSVSFAFVVGVVSGILPAIQASKLNVVDALRS